MPPSSPMVESLPLCRSPPVSPSTRIAHQALARSHALLALLTSLNHEHQTLIEMLQLGLSPDIGRSYATNAIVKRADGTLPSLCFEVVRPLAPAATQRLMQRLQDDPQFAAFLPRFAKNANWDQWRLGMVREDLQVLSKQLHDTERKPHISIASVVRQPKVIVGEPSLPLGGHPQAGAAPQVATPQLPRSQHLASLAKPLDAVPNRGVQPARSSLHQSLSHITPEVDLPCTTPASSHEKPWVDMPRPLHQADSFHPEKCSQQNFAGGVQTPLQTHVAQTPLQTHVSAPEVGLVDRRVAHLPTDPRAQGKKSLAPYTTTISDVLAAQHGGSHTPHNFQPHSRHADKSNGVNLPLQATKTASLMQDNQNLGGSGSFFDAFDSRSNTMATTPAASNQNLLADQVLGQVSQNLPIAKQQAALQDYPCTGVDNFSPPQHTPHHVMLQDCSQPAVGKLPLGQAAKPPPAVTGAPDGLVGRPSRRVRISRTICVRPQSIKPDGLHKLTTKLGRKAGFPLYHPENSLFDLLQGAQTTSGSRQASVGMEPAGREAENCRLADEQQSMVQSEPRAEEQVEMASRGSGVTSANAQQPALVAHHLAMSGDSRVQNTDVEEDNAAAGQAHAQLQTLRTKSTGQRLDRASPPPSKRTPRYRTISEILSAEPAANTVGTGPSAPDSLDAVPHLQHRPSDPSQATPATTLDAAQPALCKRHSFGGHIHASPGNQLPSKARLKTSPALRFVPNPRRTNSTPQAADAHVEPCGEQVVREAKSARKEGEDVKDWLRELGLGEYGGDMYDGVDLEMDLAQPQEWEALDGSLMSSVTEVADL